MTYTQKYTLQRTGDVPLVFEGQILAESSSWRRGRKRWSDIRIYFTNTGKWVTEMVGHSIVPGESDRRFVMVHETVDTIRDGLTREGDQGRYLTNMAQEVLAEAARNDPELEPILVERI